jgi:hypothetical protein
LEASSIQVDFHVERGWLTAADLEWTEDLSAASSQLEVLDLRLVSNFDGCEDFSVGKLAFSFSLMTSVPFPSS